MLVDEFFEDGEFFGRQLFSFVNGTTAQGYANASVFLLICIPYAVDATFSIASRAHHQAHQFIELYDCAAGGALEVEMK